MTLYPKWVILETFGVMSADSEVWRMTNIMHGYIETV